jgi:3D (Asp-Asp-Asp) domain-containing protein
MRNEELITYEYKAYQADQQRRRRRHAARRRAQAWRQRLIFLLVAAVAGVLMVRAFATDTEAALPEPEQVAVKLEIPAIPTVTPPAPVCEPAPSQVTESEEPALAYLGEFRITHYCACKKCCGKDESDPWYGITATGTKATEGRTIAVDPSVIPYGREVTIRYENGVEHTYVSEDCGGAIKGNSIDVYIADHGRARELGVKSASVYMVSEG